MVILKIGKSGCASWYTHIMMESRWRWIGFLNTIAEHRGTYFNFEGGEVHFENEEDATEFLLRWS